MTNDEAVERLKVIDFERSNSRDRLAIHTAINALSDQPRTVAEIRAEVEKWYNKFVEADNFFKQKGLSTFMSGFSAGRDTCKDILDFIDGEEK